MASATARRRLPHDKAKRERNRQVSNDTNHSNGHIVGPSTASSSSTAARTSSVLLIWAPTLTLIFGGCCSNVYTLESLISRSPSSGSLITALQFLVVAVTTLPSHISLSRGWRHAYLKPRTIPLRKWLIYTAYFLAINILNNMAFDYRISIPLHIILRSAGPVTTMAVSRVWGGKRYPTQKVVAVFLLFSGVVLAAISDAGSKAATATATAKASASVSSSPSKPPATHSISTQAPGFALLASALLLSALMGLYSDAMYSTHGRSSSITLETLFYSHTLSLPFFLTQLPSLQSQLTTLTTLPSSSPLSTITTTTSPSFLSPLLSAVTPLLQAGPLLMLVLNATTQLLCILGVNRLSTQSSSLTVSIVLNVRKLVSLVLSIWLFGNTLPPGVILGAVVVFVGGGLYALPTRRIAAAPGVAPPGRTDGRSGLDGEVHRSTQNGSASRAADRLGKKMK